MLVRVPFVGLPLERDEGDDAYVAWRMLEGDVPYRDAFDQKPPGIYAVYAALFALGPRSGVAIHLLLYAWTAACALVLHRLLRELAGATAAAFAVLAFALLAADPRLTATAATTESLMILPIVAALAASGGLAPFLGIVVLVDADGSHLLDERSERWIYGELRRLVQREYRPELLFHATPDRLGYAQAWGPEAAAWLARGKAVEQDAPWIGLYRRTR